MKGSTKSDFRLRQWGGIWKANRRSTFQELRGLLKGMRVNRDLKIF